MKIIDLLLESTHTPYQTFLQYKNNRKMFVTYTTRPAVTINPTPKFDTPIGLYTYPLDYTLNRVRGDSLFNVVPFAGNKPYISLVELKSNRVVDLKSYSSFNRDFDKLEDYVLDTYGDDVWDNAMFEHRPSGSDGKKMWTLVSLIAKHVAKEEGGVPSKVSQDIFVNVLKWDGAIDNGSGAIHRDEPTQAVFFNKNAFSVVKTMENV